MARLTPLSKALVAVIVIGAAGSALMRGLMRVGGIDPDGPITR